jgi:4'-phosphopantetheinyl transferase
MIYVYYCKNSPLPGNMYNSKLRLMPSGFVQKLNRMAHREDAQASLIGRLLLLYALQQLDYGHLELCNIQCNAHQRPYFDKTDIDFNISHSGEYVVCAIGRDNRVGIDIEQIKPIILDNFIHFFSPVELQGFSRHPKGELEGFYDLWTQKEALVKAEGSGLAFPVKDICIADGKARLSGYTWYLHELHISEGYKAHLAFQFFSDEEIQVSVMPLCMDEIVDCVPLL